MNYNAMKELSDKLTSEMKNSQATEESQIENLEGESDHEDTFGEETTETLPSGSNESEQDLPQEDRIADMLAQQQELLSRLLGEVVAQTAQLTSLELQLNGLSSSNNNAGGGIHDKTVQDLIAEVAGLKDAAQRQEKANTDILRDSKNFQAGVKARMQDELDQYHKLHAQNAYAPILTEIAGLYISTERLLDSAEDSHLKEQLRNALLDSLAELLEDNGVTIARTEVGQARSLRLCKTRKTIATGDENLKGKVAKSYNPSFVLGNQILQKEIVDTYIFDPELVPADDNVDTGDPVITAMNDGTVSEDTVIPERVTEQSDISEETVDRE